MLKLRTIGWDGMQAAAELLFKGFPSRSPAFWHNALGRLAEYIRITGGDSIGTLLMADETPVGVLLTIPRQDARTGKKIVNLSSWYVEESHRWYAPRMLMAATMDKTAVYTDLTPSRAAAELNTRLGFRTVEFNLHLLPLPWHAIAGRGQGKLHSLDALPAGALEQTLLQDLRRHRELGCIVTVVESDALFQPIVFQTFERKRIPVARVIFAENQDLIVNNLALLSRMLLMRGVPLLCLRVPNGTTSPYSKIWQRDLRYQIKGDWDESTINELFSERVLLNV